MQLGLVVGHAISTIKHASLRGTKLLVVQPLLADGVSPDGDPQVCVDTIGAGTGETVMITSDGRFTREFLQSDTTPARWTLIATKDE